MPKVLRYAGFAEEGVYNEVPKGSAFHVDIASASLDSPSEPQLVYAGGLGRGARTHRPGFYSPSGNIVYAFDIRTIGWLIRWALDGYTFTSGSPNRHEMYASKEMLLPSFCTRLGKDVFEHVFSGCAINSLELATEDGFAQATADVVAAKDSKAPLAETNVAVTGQAADDIIDATAHGFAVNDKIQFNGLVGGTGLSNGTDYYVISANFSANGFQVSATKGGVAVLFSTDITAGNAAKVLSLPAEYPLSFIDVSVELPSASDISAVVQSLTFSIGNNASAEGGRGMGSRYPKRIPVADREVMFTMGLWFEDTGQLERFWGGADGPADGGATEFASKLTLDAGADGSLVLDMPATILTKSEQQPSGRDRIVQSIDGKAFISSQTLNDGVTAVESEVLATLLNDEATMA